MENQGYRSFAEQALHYFTRPHDHALDSPLEVPAAWVGAETPALEDLAYRFTDADIAQIDAALTAAKATGKPLGEMLAADFPLPGLASRFQQWRETLASGRGFQVIRGAPVERWGQADSELFFWCFGLHLGRPGGQNPQGDLLGHVRDLGEAEKQETIRLYKTAARIDYHCDAADVVGLLCLKKAQSGGQSRIVSSVSVFNRLVRDHPDLAARLFEPVRLDNREKPDATGADCFAIPPCRYADGVLRTFYHADYFRSVARHADLPPFTETERKLFDAYEAIASDPSLYLDMDLRPGDIQLLSNHTNLHARSDYVDHKDPAKKRHLLRLWLSL